jgi:hypothetical protein
MAVRIAAEPIKVYYPWSPVVCQLGSQIQEHTIWAVKAFLPDSAIGVWGMMHARGIYIARLMVCPRR